jgi:hypothetical protein
MTITRPRLDEIARRWRWRAAGRDTLFAAAGAMVLTALALVWPALSWATPVLGFLVILGWRLAVSRPWTVDVSLLARYLDRTHPAFEESSALWLRPPESLTLLERLQLKRLNAAVRGITPDTAPTLFGAPPRRYFRTAGWWVLGGVLAVCLATPVAVQRGRLPAAPGVAPVRIARRAAAAVASPAPAWPKIVRGELLIVPPAYTGRAARRVEDLNAEVEEGSAVTWQLTLDRPVREARLVFGEAGADALPLHSVPGAAARLEGTRVVSDAGLYHLSATLPDGAAWSPPELFSLKLIRDRPPTVRILQPLLPRTVLDSAAKPFTVEILAADDYGLADAHLVATVAKGEGEAVKFREQSIAFDSNEPAVSAPGVAPGARRLVKTLDLAALGLAAGDELYFYVEARDNRQPVANLTRSETRFVTIKGPAETPPAGGLGVAGVNLVPQYFRSERQLIIDTEKLIADQPALPVEEFRRRGNDLGIDQQLLRLRYGQFEGEDYEPGSVSDHKEIQLDPLVAAPVERTGPQAAASITQRFMQEHVEQDRDGVNPQHETGLRPAPDRPLSAAQVRAPFVDEHDSQEKATFFDHQTKGTLHDALADMWQAEGFLRTNRPQEALAPEHRALDILKDLQQSDRAYVQHVGFDSPPLKIAERRLQGDVASVPPRADLPPEPPPNADSLADVRTALGAVSWNQPSAALTPAQTEALRHVEPTLTAAATAHPETFLEGLRALRRILDGRAGDRQDDLTPLEQAMFHLLQPTGDLPRRSVDPAPSLDNAYFRALSPATLGGTAP